jgi:hypothetical protein
LNTPNSDDDYGDAMEREIRGHLLSGERPSSARIMNTAPPSGAHLTDEEVSRSIGGQQNRRGAISDTLLGAAQVCPSPSRSTPFHVRQDQVLSIGPGAKRWHRCRRDLVRKA